MFQLAYATAQALGVADRAHDAMFDAVWTTGELGTTDPATGGLKAHMPTIEDAARFYQKQTGVAAARFLAMAKSFGVDSQVRRDEALIQAYGVDQTPTLVVNGKYRVTTQSASLPDRAVNPDKLIELVDWLVAKESK
jgi:thiol:disulfide interchange protein DsbA